jgi:rhodanese-related sulfurtransferase
MKYLVAISLLVLVACETGRQKNNVLPPAAFQHQLETTPDALLVDVRRPDELATGRIAGARNIVFGSPSFEQDILQLEKKPIFIYCAAGVRSAKAAALLRDHGYEVYELEGGLQNWVGVGLPVSNP